MQLQAESGRVEQGTFVTGLRKGAPPHITGVFDALAQIYRREGVTGLWRGVLANVMRSTLLVRASACWRSFSLGCCITHADGATFQVCGQLTGYGERFLSTKVVSNRLNTKCLWVRRPRQVPAAGGRPDEGRAGPPPCCGAPQSTSLLAPAWHRQEASPATCRGDRSPRPNSHLVYLNRSGLELATSRGLIRVLLCRISSRLSGGCCWRRA